MKASELVKRHGSTNAAAKATGIPRTTLRNRVKAETSVGSGDAKASVPVLPKSSLPAAAIVKRLASDARLKAKRRDAETWMPIRLHDNKPIGLVWFGDPHLGTSTNWAALERDIYTTATTNGLFGANIGDTTNNWTGRLARLYADEDISRATERKLATWFLSECGIPWLLWLMGNHDDWEHGADILRLMDVHHKVPMFDWAAKIELVFPNKSRVRINAAHDFPGHSMWNTTHGPARAPRMNGTDADLFVCGHRHDWGIQQYEMSERGRCPLAIRARGYKVGDPYARRHGYSESKHGASILTIIDPTAGPAGKVLAFADVQQGARVLTALRKGK